MAATHLDRPARRLGAGALLLYALLAAGCGGAGAVAPPVDPDQARAVLRSTLDAWKAGRPHDAPGPESPPVRVADEEWLAGARLVAYEPLPKDQVVGVALRCPVKLTVQDRAGKTIKKTVTYNVTTAPTPAVIRQD